MLLALTPKDFVPSTFNPASMRCLILVFGLVATATAYTRQNHFGVPSYLSPCFVKYEDRDAVMPWRPYAVAANGYDSTEDRCLATCLRDKNCKAAVYGMIGGRDVFTCEFYNEFGARQNPQYSAYLNMYIPRAKCQLQFQHLDSLQMRPSDDTSLKRRAKHEKMMHKPNPFMG